MVRSTVCSGPTFTSRFDNTYPTTEIVTPTVPGGMSISKWPSASVTISLVMGRTIVRLVSIVSIVSAGTAGAVGIAGLDRSTIAPVVAIARGAVSTFSVRSVIVMRSLPVISTRMRESA